MCNVSRVLMSLFFAGATTSMCGIAWAQTPVDGSFGERVTEQVFPILGKGSETSLALGMWITSYPDDTTLSTVREKLAGLSESDRKKVPEYLLLRELDLVAKGDKDEIVKLYHGNVSKDYALNERWRDMEYSTSFARDKVDHYLLQTKAQFGPFVRIRYKPVVKEGTSIGGVVVMREIDGAYYFTEELGKDSIFHPAAEAFPYWEKAAARNEAGDLVQFKEASFYCEGVSGIPNTQHAPIRVYCKLESVWEQSFPDVEVKSKIESKLALLMEGYKSGSLENIAQAWTPSQRTGIQKKLQSDPAALKKEGARFDTSSRIKPIYVVRSGPELLTYAVSSKSTSPRASLDLFRFQKEGGEYFLDENVRRGTPFPTAILRSKEMMKAVQIWIRESNMPELGPEVLTDWVK